MALSDMVVQQGRPTQPSIVELSQYRVIIRIGIVRQTYELPSEINKDIHRRYPRTLSLNPGIASSGVKDHRQQHDSFYQSCSQMPACQQLAATGK